MKTWQIGSKLPTRFALNDQIRVFVKSRHFPFLDASENGRHFFLYVFPSTLLEDDDENEVIESLLCSFC